MHIIKVPIFKLALGATGRDTMSFTRAGLRVNVSSLSQPYHRPVLSAFASQVQSRLSVLSANMSSQASIIQELHKYSACDIADALLKLEPKGSAPLAGFLADIAGQVPAAKEQKIIAPAFTVLFHSKLDSASNNDVASNIPKGKQWSDLITEGTIVVVRQPDGQRCASVGGHHAARIAHLGAKGLLVSGRIRDQADMAELGLSIWSRGTSIVGAGAESKPQATQVPIEIDGVTIEPGDLIFCDPAEGAVRIPKDFVDKVADFLPKHSEQEDNVKEMIAKGHSVQEAFEKCRG